jgi:hypothetical protein
MAISSSNKVDGTDQHQRESLCRSTVGTIGDLQGWRDKMIK